MYPFDVVHIGLGKCMSTYLQNMWARDPAIRNIEGRQLVQAVNDAIVAHVQHGTELPEINLNFKSADVPNRIFTAEGFTFSFLNAAEMGASIPMKHRYVARTIAGFAPRVLLVVRDPVSWIASAHAQSINQGGFRNRQQFVSQCRASVLNNLNLNTITQAFTDQGFEVVMLPMELLAEEPDAFWALLEHTCGLSTPADLRPLSMTDQNRTNHKQLPLAAAINRVHARLADGVRRGNEPDAEAVLQTLGHAQAWGARRGLSGADEAVLAELRGLVNHADEDAFLSYEVDEAFVAALRRDFITPLESVDTVAPMLERYNASLDALLTSPDQRTQTHRLHR